MISKLKDLFKRLFNDPVQELDYGRSREIIRSVTHTNDYNPFYYYLNSTYGITYKFLNGSTSEVFFQMGRTMILVDHRIFQAVIEDILYNSQGRPFSYYGGIIESSSEYSHSYTTLNEKTGAAAKMDKFVKDVLIPVFENRKPGPNL